MPLSKGARGLSPGDTVVMKVEGGVVSFAPNGCFTVTSGEKELVSGARLVVPGPGWRDSGSQGSATLASGYPKRKGHEVVFRGQMTVGPDKATWCYEQRVAPVSGGVQCSYELRPMADTSVQEASFFVDFPIATWSGQRVLLAPSTDGVLPAAQPKARHFLNGSGETIVLGTHATGQFTMTFDMPTWCTFQDTREFKRETYQVYSKLFAGGKITKGEICRIAFVLRPSDPATYTLRRARLDSTGEPAIANVRPNADRVAQYGKFELTFDVAGTWGNPFDPEQVAVDAVFRGPDGMVRTVPGFFFQDFQRHEAALAKGLDSLVPCGDAAWKVRFAPPVAGEYRYRLRLTNQGRTVDTPERAFTCTADPSAHGYLRVSRGNSAYLEYDDGTPFFAIGENIATLGSGGTVSADRWFGRFAEVGGNFARTWWCAGGMDLESCASGGHPDLGIGKYKLDEAWRIDYVVGLAEKLGMHLMCCLETQQYLRREKTWPRFTYNVENGGPVSSPADYFVNEEAAAYFRKRLRYIVARWSYSTAVFSWQFWNEVNACNDFHPENAARWHERMSRHLREIDPVRHVIHTNLGNLDGYEVIDKLPETEVVSTNIYSCRDMGSATAWGTRLMTERYGKPFFVTEYGIGHRGGWVPEDPTGVMLHNGLWGPVMTGSAGTGLPWGWGNWTDAQDFYHYWRPVTETVKGIPFSKRQWRPVSVAGFSFRDTSRQPYYADVFFEGWPRNYSYTQFPRPDGTEVFSVTAEGRVPQRGGFSAVLAQNKPQTFDLTFPVDGELVVHVPELLGSKGLSTLQILIDGTDVLSEKLHRDTEHFWVYWKQFAVPVSAGKHRIQLRNVGGPPIHTACELRKFRLRNGPDLDVMGIQTEDYVLLWLRNPQFIWIYTREGRQPETRDEGVLELSDVSDGPYSVVWRETTTNKVLKRGNVVAANGRVRLETPKVARSAVARLDKLK